ncbi:MAG: molybdenum cofactor guanylyltransferase [Ornithinimicrobium sp.]
MSAQVRWDAIILAGGRGQRLGGVDKALIDVGGQTLLGYAESATSQAAHVVVVGAPRPGFGHLAWTSEQPPGGGPAAGVIAGLGALREMASSSPPTRNQPAPSPWVALLAVDQPGVVSAVDALLHAVTQASDDIEALCPYDTDGHPQWLLAAYRRDALEAVCATFAPGHEVSMGRLLRGVRFTDVPQAAAHVGDIDTWADHRAWESRAESQERSNHLPVPPTPQ